MFVQRCLCCLACATCLAAQAEPGGPRKAGYLGLQLAPSVVQLTCGKPTYSCDSAMELRLVGSKPLGDSFSLEGRVGTAVMGGSPTPESALSLNVGAGLRWNFSRRGSMALGLNAYEQPLAIGGRETVRSATVGLQWRY